MDHEALLDLIFALPERERATFRLGLALRIAMGNANKSGTGADRLFLRELSRRLYDTLTDELEFKSFREWIDAGYFM